MALEVNELGIFMRVMDKEGEKEKEKEKKDGLGEAGCDDCGGFSKDEVVEDCVARILEILERKKQR
jgi:hypothetical protein